jgi:hypothetical protein
MEDGLLEKAGWAALSQQTGRGAAAAKDLDSLVDVTASRPSTK